MPKNYIKNAKRDWIPFTFSFLCSPYSSLGLFNHHFCFLDGKIKFSTSAFCASLYPDVLHWKYHSYLPLHNIPPKSVWKRDSRKNYYSALNVTNPSANLQLGHAVLNSVLLYIGNICSTSGMQGILLFWDTGKAQKGKLKK